jgi:Zn-dependent protease
MDPFSIIIFIFILLFSVIFHEVAHGIMAEKLGDPTARDAGRLTLNPIPHIDLYGSILLPAMLWIATAGSFVIGAAKPVPIDYRYFKNLRRDMFLVSIAGVATNFLLAVIATLILRLVPGVSLAGQQLLLQTIILNIGLAVFNTLPIPPLDGSKMLASIFGFFNESWMYKMLEWERFGFIIVLLFLITGLLDKILIPMISFVAKLLLG